MDLQSRNGFEIQKTGFTIFSSTPLRVQLRVVFHDRRLQNTEDEQLKNWSKGRKEFETIIIF